MNSTIKNERDLYKGIHEFNKAYQPRVKFMYYSILKPM
jgi:hypothetical protein